MAFLRTLFLMMVVFGGHAKTLYDAHTTVSFQTSKTHVNPGDIFTVFLKFHMDPGWCLYWKNPGDSGAPPVIKWKLPNGLSIKPLEMPAPKLFKKSSLATYGYENDFVMGYTISASKDFDPKTIKNLSADIEWIACEKSCARGFGELDFDNAENISLDTETGYIQSTPKKPTDDFKVSLKKSGEYLFLKIKYQKLADFQSVYFFSKIQNMVVHNAPQPFDNNVDHWVLNIPLTEDGAKIDGFDGLLQFKRHDGTLETFQIDWQDVLEKPGNTTDTGFLWVLVLAFLGGIILNFMPCVFPVLSLKIMAFASEKTKSHKKDGWSYGLGVLISFGVLGVLLMIFRATGDQIGWGFQLQSPVFVMALLLVFHVMSLSLFGVFEFGARLTRISSRDHSSFLTGVFTTIVATPCSAPFMGAALGVGLTLPWYQSFFVFLSLGLGLAAPFVALCYAPNVLKKIPKPGAWMETLKQLLGFFMAGSALWLLWVLEKSIPEDQFLYVISGLFTLTFALWVYGRCGGYVGRKRYKTLAFTLMGFALCLLLPSLTSPTSQKHVWEPYSTSAVEKHIADKRYVFIDFTARWCITCQVNKMTTLNKPHILDAFKKHNVITMRADWTNYDESITQSLEKFGRNSIPLYVLIDLKNPEKPIILPEILTEDIVINALQNLNQETPNDKK